MTHPRPKEELLHYLWRTKAFDHTELCTTDGRSIDILSYGQHNRHDGPDFLQASVKIDDIQWSGAIEMHVSSSDWANHGHDDQSSYDGVILHVVLYHDQEIVRPSGEKIPCLELKSRVSEQLLHRYHELMHTRKWIPCADHIAGVSTITKSIMTHRLLAERLEQKAQDVITLYNKNNNDLRSAVYQRIARAMGLKANAEAMLELTERTPIVIVDKHRDQLLQVEALLFGQSGLLDGAESDDYVDQLKREYSFLKNKFSLTAMRAVQWKFMRVRPAGFPTMRIAQLARLLHQTRRLDQLLFSDSIDDILRVLKIKLDGYWQTHYTFGELTAKRTKSLGADRRDLIVINAFAPILFAYGIIKGSQTHKDKAIAMLEQVNPEKNGVISKWQVHDYTAENAADTQALLHLKKHYCDQYRCLECSIGHQLIKDR